MIATRKREQLSSLARPDACQLDRLFIYYVRSWTNVEERDDSRERFNSTSARLIRLGSSFSISTDQSFDQQQQANNGIDGYQKKEQRCRVFQFYRAPSFFCLEKKKTKKKKTPRNYSVPGVSTIMRGINRRAPNKVSEEARASPMTGRSHTGRAPATPRGSCYPPTLQTSLQIVTRPIGATHKSVPRNRRRGGDRRRIYCEPGRKTYSDRLSRGSRVAVKSAWNTCCALLDR